MIHTDSTELTAEIVLSMERQLVVADLIKFGFTYDKSISPFSHMYMDAGGQYLSTDEDGRVDYLGLTDTNESIVWNVNTQTS